MKRKRFWLLRPATVALVIISLILAVLTWFINKWVFFVVFPLVLLITGLVVYRIFKIQQDLSKMLASIGGSLTDSHEQSLVSSPLSTAILTDLGEIVWYNDCFKETVLKKQDILGYNITFVTGKRIDEFIEKPGEVIFYKDSYYQLYCIKTSGYSKDMYLLYMIDITELYKQKIRAEQTNPCVMLVMIDNYEESIGSDGESAKALLQSKIQMIIQDFCAKTHGFIKKFEQDRYILVVERRDLDVMREEKFQILDEVRKIETGSGIPVTLSIGAAPATVSLSHAEQEARQALDMALGRGGDQVAIKNDEDGYEFFGGVSKGFEKRTKVKTRIVASALSELITLSDNVLIMGHKFADLDCLGSAIGLAKACEQMSKPVKIVLDVKRNLVESLLKRMQEEGKKDLICSETDALDIITSKTLLIITDTHSKALLESNAVYESCEQVVIIDHHRKLVNHITNAAIFYHETYASSASEMVTELLQYFGDECKITKFEADALLSGIMLDTKNFVIRTGVRTFEAAAYLRRMGADTVKVRQLFASSMAAYQRKTRVVSGAEIYKECAIACCDFTSDDLRIVAPQAADELLSINGVKASFVIYEQGETVNISARSMGAMNVQIVMEKLGGGGHHTMAAAQIKDVNIDKARQMLLEAIDDFEQNN